MLSDPSCAIRLRFFLIDMELTDAMNCEEARSASILLPDQGTGCDRTTTSWLQLALGSHAPCSLPAFQTRERWMLVVLCVLVLSAYL
jgi:hypothetical protein